MEKWKFWSLCLQALSTLLYRFSTLTLLGVIQLCLDSPTENTFPLFSVTWHHVLHCNCAVRLPPDSLATLVAQLCYCLMTSLQNWRVLLLCISTVLMTWTRISSRVRHTLLSAIFATANLNRIGVKYISPLVNPRKKRPNRFKLDRSNSDFSILFPLLGH
jgi:hypothetical protein